jgi:capsular polysaccharide biosynthesis protein
MLMSDNHVDNRAIDTYEEISLRELIETLWKGKVLVAITTVIALLLASVVTFFVLPEKYNATVVLRANQIKLSNTYSGEDAAAFADLENKLLLSTSQYAEMLAKEDFLEQLSASLSLKNPDGTVVPGEALGALIATQTNDSASTITVTVTDSDPDRAFLIAEGIENDFITFINKFVNTNVDLYTTTLSNNLNMAKTALDTKEEALSVFRRENGNIDLLTDEVNRLQARIKEINQNISMYE